MDVAQAPSPVNRRRGCGACTPEGPSTLLRMNGCATRAGAEQHSEFTPIREGKA
jgi:hypothetical protein